MPLKPTTFTAAVERHGPRWVLTVIELGLMDTVERFDRIEYVTRALVCRHRGLPGDSFDVRIIDGGGCAL